MKRRLRVGLRVVVAALVACEPRLESNDALVTAPQILAVRADPPEARPGATVTFTPLVAGPDGPVEAPAIAWSYCVAPEPLTEDNVVSDVCLGAQALVPLGEGSTASGSIPGTACSLFGPDVSMQGARPRDPDATGGYYQPLLARLGTSEPTVELVRITCDLADATSRTVAAFAAAYAPNENPTLLPLVATAGGAPASLAEVAAGARVVLTASWPAKSAETYAFYDAVSGQIGDQRESMEVAWYTSRGAFDAESTGRASGDPATTSTNTFTAPGAAGTTTLWVVLRDSRGGVDFATYRVNVVPP